MNCSHLTSIFLMFTTCVLFATGSPTGYRHNNVRNVKSEEVDWAERGRQELQDALNVTPLWAPARNVIIFLGDGMGVSTQTAARIFKAQRRSESATEGKLSWESMPYTGLLKTYNTDQMTGDSAGCASAVMSGEKTRSGVIGVNQHVTRGNCTEVAGNELVSLVNHALIQDKWVGLVSTDSVAAASVAPAYAHSADRDWMAHVPEPYTDTCWDIARQLVHTDINKNIRVIQGGGRRDFTPNNVTDPENGKGGQRLDGRDLIQDWLDIHYQMGFSDEEVVYARNSEEFNNTDGNTVEYFMGLYAPGQMAFEADREEEDPSEEWSEPSLTQMVEKSLEVLSRAPNGYILYVEGSQIDDSHHSNRAHFALIETMAFESAVASAMDQTNSNDTLILVTADHSHVFTITGYPKLDTDILGLVVDQDDKLVLADDDKPYQILAYINGPGYATHRMVGNEDTPRMNLTGVDTTGKKYVSDSGILTGAETHAGEDVTVYARGPMAHLFTGQHEQNYLGHAVMYAACIGPNTANCDATDYKPRSEATTATTKHNVLYIIFSVYIVLEQNNIFI